MPQSKIMRQPDKILIVRNDKLGDFTLALPTFALLKKYLPDTELTALVPGYTQPIAEACPYIDQILLDPGASATRAKQKQLLKQIQTAQFDVSLTLYSTTRIGLLLKRSRIPVRIAPATKLAQIFHNHRVLQRRSQSHKPEYEYNLDLARYLLGLLDISAQQVANGPYLGFSDSDITKLKSAFLTKYDIAANKHLIFIHPGSGGSANNLSVEQYAELARALATDVANQIIISAGPTEVEIASQLSKQLAMIPHTVYLSEQGLTTFAKHIGFADCFISGSTGPLHVAGALNRPTIGFYPARRSATSLRWQTINDKDRRLAFSPSDDAEQEDMSRIDIEKAIEQTRNMLSRLYQ